MGVNGSWKELKEIGCGKIGDWRRKLYMHFLGKLRLWNQDWSGVVGEVAVLGGDMKRERFPMI